MKKYLFALSLFFIICLLCVGCSGKNNDDNTTSTTENTIVSSAISTETTENQTEKQTSQTTATNNKDNTTTTTTKNSQSNPLISDEDLEKIENSNAEVYFTDNPDNKYIVTISNKYGAKKENLVALIKVNAEFPSAMVFEFSGKKDENGELVMTYDEFKYFYNIDESNNKIIRVSKNGVGNDGVNFVEAQVYLMLAREYLIPELPNLKANKRYPE